MGNPVGFKKILRRVASDRPVQERLGDFEEFHLKLDEGAIKEQASRCMNCGVPFCHSGILIKGMTSGCPLHNVIPEFNDLVYNERWAEAYAMLASTNSFPEFTGRVCPAPCEGSCVLGSFKDPVTIKEIEKAIIEKAFEKGYIKANPPSTRTGKKVAVVGSGPAGLAAANILNHHGHSVTVYERSDRPGGLLMYGIPNMKLSKAVVERRIKLMEAEGVRFELNTEISQGKSSAVQKNKNAKSIPAQKILADYDAVILAAGATKPRDLGIPGRDLEGIYFAVDYLHLNTKSFVESKHADHSYIDAKGKTVLVIGGGDTGTDCVATALRHGAKSVKQLEILAPRPNSRAPSNPWPEWPNVLSVDYGQREAIEKFGADPRQYTVTALRFIGDSQKLKAVVTAKVEWQRDDQGRMSPKTIAGSEEEIPADMVLLAMGFVGPEESIVSELGLKTDERSNVSANPSDYKTSLAKVFSAGDMRRGQSLVVWAINEGQEAAQSCHKFLQE